MKTLLLLSIMTLSLSGIGQQFYPIITPSNNSKIVKNDTNAAWLLCADTTHKRREYYDDGDTLVSKIFTDFRTFLVDGYVVYSIDKNGNVGILRTFLDDNKNRLKCKIFVFTFKEK